MADEKVIIIGAGLSGSLLAIYLAKRGIKCDVFESRGDMRLEEVAAGRSINLALSNRGIAALREIGLDEYMLSEAVPMFGRMIHTLAGETKLLPYSGRQGEYINSVSRTGLNIALMDEAEKYSEVTLHFGERCIEFDCASGDAGFSTGKRIRGATVIATDGAGSAVRNSMLHGGVQRFDFSQRWLEHGYKELHIPPAADGGFRLEKNALHIWARGSFMMIALPNIDGSFTCTLFLAHHGDESFASLHGEDVVLEFFKKYFADAVPLMPKLVEDFFANPTGNLGTIKCFPWNAAGNALLLGDAAHAFVPFYGQGMNASFEDCRVLNELVGAHGDDWPRIFDEFTDVRKANADAIADMAEENFYEMRDTVSNPVFQLKRELETHLEQTFPDYFSKYSMVTFRDDLPYSVAKAKGNAQDEFLMKICTETTDLKTLDLPSLIKRIESL